MLEIIKKAMDKAIESGDFQALQELMDRFDRVKALEDRKTFDLKMINFKNDLKAKEDSRNDHQNFNYISYKELSRLIKPLQEKHGLNFITKFDLEEVKKYGESLTYPNGKEKVNIITMAFVTGSIEIRDTKTGYSELIPISAHAFDTSDKAGGKAKSEAHKRAIFKLLDVAAEMDDNDSNNITPDRSGSGKQYGGGSSKVESFNKKMLSDITNQCSVECGIKPHEAKKIVFRHFQRSGGEVNRFFGKGDVWSRFKSECIELMGGNNIEM